MSQDHILGRKLTRVTKKHWQHLEPLLDLSGEWRLSDADLNMDNAHRSMASNLVRLGAIERVKRNGENTNGSVYRWHPSIREALQEYAEQLNRLPCGCRAHIPPGDKAPGDWYACKHCGAGHTRQTIQAAMDR